MDTDIVVATIGLVGTAFTAFFAYKASSRSKRIDDAVNQRHPDEPKLYDRIVRINGNVEEVRDEVAANTASLDRNEAAHQTIFGHLGIDDPTDVT